MLSIQFRLPTRCITFFFTYVFFLVYFDDVLLLYYHRALFVSLPATMLLITLVCMSGLVIYAAYATCDPLLDGKIIARDQVSLDGNIITDGNKITNDQVSLDLI